MHYLGQDQQEGLLAEIIDTWIWCFGHITELEFSQMKIIGDITFQFCWRCVNWQLTKYIAY